MNPLSIYLSALILPISFLTSLAAEGQNLTESGDLWKQRFKILTTEMSDAVDVDGDGYSNLKEYTAGTNPLDPNSKLNLRASFFQGGERDISFSFKTVEGKFYKIERSADLSDFSETIPGWWGDGGDRELTISKDGSSEAKHPVRAEFWKNIASTSMRNLTDLETFPLSPDGVTYLLDPESPQFLAAGYGARLGMWIVAPRSGNYQFYLSSGSVAELLFGSISQGQIPSKIVEILPAQVDPRIGQWHGGEGAMPVTISLNAGQRYHLELRYIDSVGGRHCQIGWSGPGLTEIEKIDHDDLAKVYTPPGYQVSGHDFYHDYDSNGQTEPLWPADSELKMEIPGMSRSAERFSLVGTQQDTGLMKTLLPRNNRTLYATWLFNMGASAPRHGSISLVFGKSGSGISTVGPRINLEERNPGGVATVRGGGPAGNQVTIDVAFDRTFRVELIATTDPLGFRYPAPGGAVMTVDENKFDLYVSNVDGSLVGSAKGLTFQDGDLVEEFGEFAMTLASNPNIAFDSWEVTDGSIAGNGYLVSNHEESVGGNEFFRLSVSDQDQDNDGVSDHDELSLAKFHRVLFFDPEAANGTPDGITADELVRTSTGPPMISLVASDAAAFESNHPSAVPDDGKVTITRTGTLEAITVKLCVAPLENTGNTATVCDGSCCLLVGSAGDEKAENGDYVITDADGNNVSDHVDFAFGETSKILTVRAVKDAIVEYPETLNLAVEASTDGRYSLSPTNGASIQLFDLPDDPVNTTYFTGVFSQDGRAVVATRASGFATARINGTRTKIQIWDEFSGLSSAQQDSHIHKASPGGAPGDIIYSITATPGDDETDPLNGPLVGYLWDLATSSGTVPTNGGSASKQAIVDSLFKQNSETPLYINIHTVDNPAGEIWAFFTPMEGSVTNPGDAEPDAIAGSDEYPMLTGELLEVDVRRFLNQATFGATDENVTLLLDKINTARVGDPNYHQHRAFSDWIDDQMNPQVTPQTFLLDFALASHFQHLKASGIYDPLRNPTDGVTATPGIPQPWPFINRSDPNPNYWFLSGVYPLTSNEETMARDQNGINLNHFGPQDVLCADWQLKLNARDQLRHKMGFALQQIVVTSDKDLFIGENPYGSANYRDMLNSRAFSHYRDVLGFANWSPVMGHWLSSIKNQKAIDFDNDGVFDSYPDENLARENMQLFSIGLFDLWSDGTLKLSSEGLPKQSYSNDDIQEFAKIMTGQGISYAGGTAQPVPWGGGPFIANNTNFFASHTTRGLRSRPMLYPMIMFGSYHSPGVKRFAGTTIDNTSISNSNQRGQKDIESAMDWLAGKPGDGQPDFDMIRSHVSTPAFISRLLIQRFTTSNPTKGYLHRVATAFKNSEGNLGQTIKAILLDTEARNVDLGNRVFGAKKSPLEAYQQMVRALGGHTYFPLTQPGAGEAPYSSLGINYAIPDLYLKNFGYPAAQINGQERNVRFRNNYSTPDDSSGLQMDPAYQETVFNFYLPDYSKGGVISDADLVAPEMQLATEPNVIRNINYFYTLIFSTSGQGGRILGESESDQNRLFGLPGTTRDLDNLRLPLQGISDSFYPATAPAATSSRTSESLADEALLDALDKRLTNGLLKIRYPYDATDNDDPATSGVDDLRKNPRELIIDTLTASYSNANDGTGDAADRLNKLREALYLLTLCSEYQIRK